MLLNPYLGSVGVGTGGPTYFFEERFEPTGYTNSWTEAGTGTIDEDYTGVILEGSQSLRLAASTNNPRTTAVLPSDQAELWLFFKMRIVVGLSANRQIFNLADTGGTSMVAMNLTTTNTVAVVTNGVGGTATTDAMTTGTTYNLWIHALKGSGSNGSASVGFSTTGTEVTGGNAFSSKTNGTNTADFHSITFRITNDALANTTGELVLDQLLMSTTETIGNDPA